MIFLSRSITLTSMPCFSYLTDDAEKENTAPSQESSTTLRDCQNDTNEGENCKGELCINKYYQTIKPL